MPRRRAYHHGNLRETLLASSLTLIEKEGLGALSLREVARRAGVSTAAPYHHFPDRAALLSALAAQGFSLLAQEMRVHVEKAEPTPEARLEASGIGYVSFALRHAAHFRIMFRPELRGAILPEHRAAAAESFAMLVDGVDACRAAGFASDVPARSLVMLAWSVVHGIASLLLEGAVSGELAALSVTPQVMGREVSAAFRVLLTRTKRRPH